jgi:predicted glycosyltransferase
MDKEFRNLIPCTSGSVLEDVRHERKKLLISHFKEYQPDIFITELYPFGRKAFRFELDPVLSGIRDGSLPPCKCYCSVRDILVEKQQDRKIFEQRVVETLNKYFNGVLIHSDPDIIRLNETFDRMTDIKIPVSYTGFVTKPFSPSTCSHIRDRLKLPGGTRLIVGSIGGGNVGGNLLQAILEACRALEGELHYHLQLFCGLYSPPDLYERIKKYRSDNISVDIFTDNFQQWLTEADLSISMGGYNTCMDLLQAKIPALIYPFRQNREQQMRGLALQGKSTVQLLDETELSPKALSRRIKTMLHIPPVDIHIDLNGAARTVHQLNLWQNR